VAAAAGAGLLAGPAAAGAGDPVEACDTPSDPSEPFAAATTAIEADLPIQGSPHLGSTGLSHLAAIHPWTADQARLIHFHLAERDRDRLLLGLP